jgi:hypothetical protein
MQCPNCYDEEIHGFGINRVVKKVHLQMENVCYEDGYEYFQCPRCAMTRKQRTGFFSSGPIENASPKEVKEMAEKSSGGGGIAAVVGLGVAALLVGAMFSSDEKK